MIHYSKKFAPGLGGKAKGLYELRNTGLAVPDFLVIPFSNFENIIANHQSQKSEIAAVRRNLLNYELPEKDSQQLEKILKQWNFPKQAVVVRSSVLDEDGQQLAFPGLMDSFMNIRSKEELESAIGKSAASAYSDRAVAYRKQNNITEWAQPAVIVQQQIIPDSSGVVFTTFPEFPQEMAIHAVYGFGETLVQGKTEADEFYFEKKSGKLHRKKIAVKEVSMQIKAENGLQLLNASKEKQEIACLDSELLKQIFETAQKAEKSFDRPLDIEFAVKDSEVFYLQARPITQGIPEVVVYDNSNIQESYCGVTTPLTYSFASRAYKTVYSQTMQVLGIPKQEISHHDQLLSNLLGLIKGRIYYNINNWYRGLQLLPSFKQNKADMELMMGLEEPVDFIEDIEKSFSEKIKLLPKLALNYFRLWRKIKALNVLVPQFQKEFQEYYEEFYNNDLIIEDASEFFKKKKDLDNKLLNSWSTPILNDFNVMMRNGSTIRLLKKAGIAEAEAFLGRYFSGDQEIESTQPTLGIIALAEKASEFSKLKKVIIELPENIHSQVQKDFPNFYQDVEEFIHKYGDRTVGELKLETQTMRVRPLIFYKYLRNFLMNEEIKEPKLESVSNKAKQELENHLWKKNFLFQKKLKNQLYKLKIGIRYREIMRLERTRLFGMYRSLYRSFGSFLAENDYLQNPEDVFYLSEDEFFQFQKLDLKNIIVERKKEFNEFEETEVPSRVVIPSPPIPSESDTNEDPNLLKGQTCYPGRVTGEVVVIKNPSDDLNVNGKIVCALRTDPGWAALFPTCKAVLIEKGSSLSHSVILLRELGIPSIINIKNLCKKLNSGDQVNVDAQTGEVKILSNEEN